MIDEKTVRGWLREITDRIAVNQAAVSRLRGEIAKDTQKQQALEALLASDPPAGRAAARRPTRQSPPAMPNQVAEHPIKSGAVAVLKESGKPLHISDLRRALEQRGIPIPGKGTDANVIVYLSRAADVCRVGKGLYALRGWGVPAVPPRRRRSRHRRSKRQKKDS
jgi:hypothetical protein